MPDPNAASPTVNRSYAARISRKVLSRTSARLGLSWIAILASVGAAAPLLANSHPLLLSAGGSLSSPALRFLHAGDLALLAILLTILLTWPIRLGLKRRLLTVTAVGLATLLIGSLFADPPRLTVYDQYRQAEAAGAYDWVLRAPIPYSPKDYLRDAGDTGLEAPLEASERSHWFGTEVNGADAASRMIHAARIALAIGFVATGIAMFIGTIMGGLMGYFSGRVDMLGMRLVEIFEAIPTLFLLLTFVAFFGRSLYIMMIIIGFTSWPGFARYVRAEFLKLREQDYIQAAIASGLSLPSILFRHMLPNGVAPVLVAASFSFASAILAEATLSFLGLGLVDDPSWGQMLNQAVQSSTFNWWLAAFPGGAIFLTVFAYNMIGEAIRDAVDPLMNKGASDA